MATVDECDPKVPFSISVGDGATPLPGLTHFTLDPYLIILSAKQGGIKYHFWVFGMTRPGIECLSPEPLENTLTTMPISGVLYIEILNTIRKHVSADKICIYCSMNKQYMKGAQKIKPQLFKEQRQNRTSRFLKLLSESQITHRTDTFIFQWKQLFWVVFCFCFFAFFVFFNVVHLIEIQIL